MTDISDFDKDQLADYAKEEFNVVLDLRRNIDSLKAEVIKLQEAKAKPAAVEEKPVLPECELYIMNIETDKIFPWSELIEKHLGSRGRRCNAAGEPV
jgi:hypothetical protein